MLLAITAIFAGFALLIWSSDKFVDGASAIARHSGLSPLIIGLTIVGLGTSAPEMIVSGMAAIDGNAGLGVGNAIGSNITNIALILGITALLIPLKVQSGILKKELPILIVLMLAAGGLIAGGQLGTLQGAALLLMLVGVMAWLVIDARGNSKKDILADEFEHELESEPVMPLKEAIIAFLIGLLVMLGSAKLLVWGATFIAHSFGISDLVIGLTIVAIGTSLPELAASIASARKGEHDIALGNVIGSNMFNILGVMALPGLIAPGPLPEGVLSRDYPLMLLLTIGLFAMAWHYKPERRSINRLEGGLLVAAFFGYQTILYLSVTGANV
ncbi:MAG: calcium/sodium antiporter [bacterium]